MFSVPLVPLDDKDSACLVIKVNFGDTLRRFSIPRNGTLDLDMNGLRAKIFDLFKFAPDVDLTLKYRDEDNDVVTLVDDNDLRDAIRQQINPLRINVLLNSKRVDLGSSEVLSPRRSPPSETHLLPTSSGVVDFLKSVPAPLRHAVLKLSRDFTSRVTSSAPIVSVPEPLKEVISKFSNDLTSKPAISSPNLAELLESFFKVVVSEGGSSSQSSDGSAVNPDGGKRLKESVFTEDVSSNDKFVEPIPANIPNSVGSVGTSVLETTIEQFNLNEVAKTSEYSTLNSSTSQVPTSTDEKAKQKTVLRQHDPKSPATSYIQPSPSYSPFAPNHTTNPTRSYIQPSPTNHIPTNPPRSYIQPSPSYSSFAPVYSPTEPAVNLNPNYIPINDGFNVRPFHSNCNVSDNNMGRIFHKGVRCDGCGVHPITGPRFKSKVKVDYDLCSICFAEMGNDADYMRIDWPKSYGSFKDIHPHHPRFRSLSLPRAIRRCPMRSDVAKFDSCFIQDVNIIDGTEMAPATTFTKIWRMRNSGSITWPRGTQLVWIGGNKLTSVHSVEVEIPVEGCLVAQDLDIAVDFTAPEVPGQYVSYWRMSLPSGKKFGQCVWVLIQVQVDASQPDAVSQSFSGLNLNLPPKSANSKGHVRGVNAEFKPLTTHIDMNLEPIDLNRTDPDVGADLVKPLVDAYHNKQGPGLNVSDAIPRNNNDLVHALLEEPAAISYPVISVSAPQEVPTAVSYSLGDFPVVPSGPSVELPMYPKILDENNMVEQTLLKELNDMGFKQIDLNKEILRRNEYNLEQSVEDLCDVSEWDPMLEELQEMGFSDKETNTKLLIKNGGSIKRVVMDLIAGEKA